MLPNPMSTILIWDHPDAPPVSLAAGKTIIFWCSYSTHDLDSAVSIPQWVEDHADRLRQRYLSWVYEIGETQIQGQRVVDHLQLRPGFSAWWMSLLAEKCNFVKSTHIDDAIKLIALIDWISCQTIELVVLVSAKKKLAQCLRVFSKQKRIGFDWQYSKAKSTVNSSILRRLYSNLPHILQALIWLWRRILSRWELRGVGLPEWQHSRGDVTFISYLCNLVPKAAKQGLFESRYWGKLPNILHEKGIKTNWLHIYFEHEFLPTAKDAVEHISRFNGNAKGLQSHVTIDSFLSVRIIIRSLFDWLYLVYKGISLPIQSQVPKVNGINFWPLFEDDWKSSIFGKTAIANTLHLNLLEAAFGTLPKQALGIYLQENMDWEYAAIHTWKNNKHGRFIGCPHSTVRFWDLRYSFDIRVYTTNGKNSMPMPDLVAVNGLVAKCIYLEGGFCQDKLLEVEALRFMHLNQRYDTRGYKCNTIPNSSTDELVISPLRILVLAGYVEANIDVLMGILSKIGAELLEKITITVKPHPAMKSISSNDYPDVKFSVSTSELYELLESSDVAYVDALTSAAVDAYCARLPVISLLDPTTLNMSPLRECYGITFISTPAELIKAINEVMIVSKNKECPEQFFHLDETLPRWKQLIQSVILDS